MPLFSNHTPRFLPVPVSSVAIFSLDATIQVDAGEQRCDACTNIVHLDCHKEVFFLSYFMGQGRDYRKVCVIIILTKKII